MKTLWILLGIIFLNIILYFGVWNFGFVYDDLPFIVNNPVIHSLTPIHKFITEPAAYTANFFDPQVYRPLAAFINAIEWRVFGNNAGGYHIVNLLLHLLNIVLVYWLLNLLFKKRWLAVFGALFFSIHPAATEVVDWIATQNSQIWLVLFLASLIAICKSSKLIWLSMIFWALSMLTKETAFFGVFIFPLIFYFQENQDLGKWKKIFFRSLPYLILAIIYFFVRRNLPGGLGVGDFGTYLTTPALFHKYISLFFWPTNLIASYDPYTNFPFPSSLFDSRVLFGILEAGILLAWLVVAWWKKRGMEVFGIIWFFVFLLPVLQLLLPTVNIIGERALYAPAIGLVVAVIGASVRISKSSRREWKNLLEFVFLGLCIFYIIFFCFATYRRHWDWENPKTLWESALRVDRNNIVAYLGLTHFYLNEGKDPENARKLAEYFLLYWPDHFNMRAMLAASLFQLKKYNESEIEYMWVQKHRPENEAAFLDLQEIYRREGVNSGIILNLSKMKKERIQIFKVGDSEFVLTHNVIDEDKFSVLLRPGLYRLKVESLDSAVFSVEPNKWTEALISL